MPLNPVLLEQLRGVLVRQAGGYLRNPIREPRVTCAVCATPCPGYQFCVRCLRHRREPGQRADLVGFLTYAVAGSQAGYVMRGYKATPAVEEHRTVVAMTAIVGIGFHTRCAEDLSGRAVTHWGVIPSLPSKPGEHALRRLVSQAAFGDEVGVAAAAAVADPRAVDPNHFAMSPMPAGSHLMLFDDTWAGGGHVQSAVLAARAAGASYVSVLVVARWIDPRWTIDEFGTNDGFMRARCAQDYDPMVCPWTGGACP